MNIKCVMNGFAVVASAWLLCGAAPATLPAGGPDTSIAKGLYHFPAPAVTDWSPVNPDPAADSITFLNTDHDGAIQLVLLPKDTSADPDVAMQFAVAIVKQLKAEHAQQKTVMVMEPRIEKDKRFAFVIHEKYKAGDRVADQLHVYRSVGPRVLMLTVNSVAADEEKSKAIHAAGEDLLAAVKFNRKAFKKDN